MFENVIVGVDDFDGGLDAVALANLLRSPRGTLTLAYVYVVAPKPAPDSRAITDAANRRRALKRLSEARDEWSVDARVSCVEARSARAGLHDLAASERADLLVVGASRRDDYERVFVGDDTREALTGAPCAVAVAPAGYSARARALTKIGVAYNGSPPSEAALLVARRLATERGATLSAFESVRPPVAVRDVWDTGGEVADRVERARQRIAALGGVEPHAESGDDAAEGLRQYGASVDLLVIGSHEDAPIGGGGVSQRLAADASCPLLALPSPRS